MVDRCQFWCTCGTSECYLGFVWKNVKLISIQILILYLAFCTSFKTCTSVPHFEEDFEVHLNVIWFVWKNVKLISILILCTTFCTPFKTLCASASILVHILWHMECNILNILCTISILTLVLRSTNQISGDDTSDKHSVRFWK